MKRNEKFRVTNNPRSKTWKLRTYSAIGEEVFKPHAQKNLTTGKEK